LSGEQIHLLSDAAEGEAEFTVAIAEKVIEVLEDILNGLTDKMGPAYISGAPGTPVTPVGVRAMAEKVLTKIDDISSELVKIEK
jgi:hypothetical protein